ncbi:hypothetical protein [Microbacterium sp. nov. GSS16]|uniref:hypothetical protein n=1 Tax=Microbacterium sp. nov. GSS16 TaxID=3019890 RepID=UPI00230505E2|nr:hypothetical protein [Microbacterium sp. nov. GSS16]WCD93586.1 hypothetical protein PGB26_04690 [Microbacterium sp. nov. GSS16]
MRTAPKSALFITALALAVGLSGCSGAPAADSGDGKKADEKPAASSQSVADACQLFVDEGTEISNKAQELSATASTDPAAAADALADVQKEFEALGEKITNEEVSPVYNEFVSAYGEFSTIIGEVSADPSQASDAMTKVNDTVKKVSDASTELGKICNG